MQQMEIALMKQHHVLSSFIANIENEIRTGSLLMPGTGGSGPSGATPEALAAARTLQQQQQQQHRATADTRIEVSDDEDTSDDSDSDDEEEEVQVSDDSESVPRITVSELLPSRETKDDIKIIELVSKPMGGTATDIFSTLTTTDSIVPVDLNLFVQSDDLQSDDVQREDVQSEDEGESDTDDDEVITATEPLITISKVLPTAASASVQYDTLKVDDLRKTVVDQSLATKEEAKKLKKNELLALLKNAVA